MHIIKYLAHSTFIFFLIIVFHFSSSSVYAVEPTFNSWTSLGFDGYRVNNITVDPNNKNILYAAVAGNGIFKSTDSGDNWVAINNGLPSDFHSVGVVINPNDSSILYTAGGTGVWKSTDDGASWISIGNGISFPDGSSAITSLLLHPENDNMIYIGIYHGGLWKTIDGGLNWTNLLGTDIYTLAMDPEDSNVIYTGGGAGDMIGKSTDGGISWTFANSSQLGSCEGVGAVRGIAIDPNNTNILYAGPEPALCATAGVYKSIDANLNWSPLTESPGNAGGSIVTDPLRLNTVYAAESGSPYQSIDGGISWTNIRENLPATTIRRLVVTSNNINVLYAGTDTGAYIYGLEESIPEPQTLIFTPSGDTYLRSGQDNHNYGNGGFMQIRSDGDNRSLVRFDQQELDSSIMGTVLSAKLKLTIIDNGNNWGSSGRTVDIHRLISNWSEGNGTENDRGTGSGATWNCAIDSIIQNQAKNCTGATEWEMGQPNNPAAHPWAQSATATQTITNNQSGIVEFDVTTDVANFLNSTNQNYGWIIKKTNEGQSGQVSFGTKESAFSPQLMVTYQP